MGADQSSPLMACCTHSGQDDGELIFASDAEFMSSFQSRHDSLPSESQKPHDRVYTEIVTDIKDYSCVQAGIEDKVSIVPVLDFSARTATKASLRCEAHARTLSLIYLAVLGLQAICLVQQWYLGIVGSLFVLACGQIYNFFRVDAIVPAVIKPHIEKQQDQAKPDLPDAHAPDTKSFWLLIRKYGWALEYTVNLTKDGTVHTEEPLRLAWKKMRRIPEENPHLDNANIGALTEGNPVACERDIWRYTSSVKNGEVFASLNVAKMGFIVRPDGVFAEKDGAYVHLTHAWVHVDYIWGVPNMTSVSVLLHNLNTMVLSSDDIKRLAAPA